MKIDNIIEILLQEKITHQQKIEGSRGMDSVNYNPIVQLGLAFNERWEIQKNRKLTKEDIRQRLEESRRYKDLIELSKKMRKDSDGEVQEYLKKIIGDKIPWLALKSDIRNTSYLNKEPGHWPFLYIADFPIKKEGANINGFVVREPDEKIKRIMKKLILSHEYGHLFHFLNRYVITGRFPLLADTIYGTTQEVVDSEGEANAYALDNMNKYDRREFLKKTDTKQSDLKNAKYRIRGYPYRPDAQEYLAGTEKHSKKLKDTYDSIKKKKNILERK